MTVPNKKASDTPQEYALFAPKKKRHYINNSDILPEVIRAKEKGYLTNELAKMFMLIVEKIGNHPSFSRYSFLEDMKGFALCNLVANGLKFDPSKSSNAFSYYTTAVGHSFLQYIAEEKKQGKLKDDLLLESGANASSTTMNAEHDEYVERHRESDNVLHHNKDYVADKDDQAATKKKKNFGFGAKRKQKAPEVAEPTAEIKPTAKRKANSSLLVF